MSLVRALKKSFVLLIFTSILCGCINTRPTNHQTSHPKISDLQIIDCLLPGQVRRLGNSTYITPRRPTNTTAADCRIRGGEYVEYDRANYKSSLNVWLATARQGDADAQVNVGEIFERGTGGEPNYKAAAIWYTKAANQGNERAQFNLGTLYEQGLGVPKNKLLALNWYRKAWGMPTDDLIFQSAAKKEQQLLKAKLQKKLNEKSSQIGLLKNQTQSLRENLRQKNSGTQTKLKQLTQWIAKLEQEKAEAKTQLTALPIFREPQAASTSSKHSPVKPLSLTDVKFGKYYALVIGNQNYTQLESLYSPRRDAKHVATVLERKYGFSVQLLLDATNIEVMQAINDLNGVLSRNDNLLIFYAGHGSRVKNGSTEDGYWLPVNANPPPTDTFWVSNEFITRHLSRLSAKRVLVVADSCYAGLLSNAPDYLFMGDKPNYTEEYLRYKLQKKSRLILSSGGDKPVLDNAGQGHSIFAKAFLEALESNTKIIAGPELYIKIRDRVTEGSHAFGYDQEPVFKAIKGAGHEVGDFFFVPLET
ncbi:caspase family protein [Neptunomonas sp.]|uniref:caspase family protein n=1 Tax=Neptunomonas sp. TaxID=1971898 RepID=UPI0025F9BCE8|nr:caspase family protein [Neptunomonas sp.]